MKKIVFVIMPLAFISLFLGMLGGWVRIGYVFPIPTAATVTQHGILMVGSFLGTLISVERVVTQNNNALWLFPLTTIVSLPLILTGYTQVGYYAILIGSLGYLYIMFGIWKSHNLRGHSLMLIGAVFQVGAIILLIVTGSYPMALGGWIMFLLFTIVGERLDLIRFLPVSKNAFKILYACLLLVVVGMSFYHSGYAFIAGLGLILVAVWLFLNDIALINIRKTGSYKFLGYALLGAYFWLFIFGFLLLINLNGTYAYDALVHSFFVGFVLNMILAHAPIILPSVLGFSQKPFHVFFYVWLIILHLSLFLRLYGDLSQNIEFRKLGGLLNGLSFLLYMANVATLVFKPKLRLSHD
ncbi:hypothetical protein SAMN06298216_2943 [Spirosomataceae bacterium TFI 002]|nr:hypothetical protein SAMN06298216_2943 [Spirosomataceae bacterium TFI 002]